MASNARVRVWQSEHARAANVRVCVTLNLLEQPQRCASLNVWGLRVHGRWHGWPSRGRLVRHSLPGRGTWLWVTVVEWDCVPHNVGCVRCAVCLLRTLAAMVRIRHAWGKTRSALGVSHSHVPSIITLLTRRMGITYSPPATPLTLWSSLCSYVTGAARPSMPAHSHHCNRNESVRVGSKREQKRKKAQQGVCECV